MTNAEIIKAARIIADSIHVHSSFQDWEAAEKDTLEKCADALEAADKRIAKLEAQEPTEAQWVYDDITGEPKCSNCGADAPIEATGGQMFESPYCWYCGARMKGEQE